MSKIKKSDSIKKKELKLTIKEKRLLQFAQEAWQKTMRDLYYPPLSEPNYVFEYSNKEGFFLSRPIFTGL